MERAGEPSRSDGDARTVRGAPSWGHLRDALSWRPTHRGRRANPADTPIFSVYVRSRHPDGLACGPSRGVRSRGDADPDPSDAALQHRAHAADLGHPPSADVGARASALGASPSRWEPWRSGHQRARRDGRTGAGVPSVVPHSSVHGRGRRVLRVATGAAPPAAVRHPEAGSTTACVGGHLGSHEHSGR